MTRRKKISSTGTVIDMLDPLGAVGKIISEICGHRQAMRQLRLQMKQVQAQADLMREGVRATLELELAKIEAKCRSHEQMIAHANRLLADQKVRGEATARCLEMTYAAAVNPQTPAEDRQMLLDTIPQLNTLMNQVGEESLRTFSQLTTSAVAHLEAMPPQALLPPAMRKGDPKDEEE